MSTEVIIEKAGALATLQDAGRFGALGFGVSASGPMDCSGYAHAGAMLSTASRAAIEFTTAGLSFSVAGDCWAGFAGGDFVLRHGGIEVPWPAKLRLAAGDRVDLVPGRSGNYGYVRFDREIDVVPVLGSVATNSRIGLGGLKGRALQAGDRLVLTEPATEAVSSASRPVASGPIRVIWGAHADLFDPAVRRRLVNEPLQISSRMDRMGVRLNDPQGIFTGTSSLSLVSEPVVVGDLQILGDGTPIVLMRDHQPTGGYPRIATLISADIDRFAQLRPGAVVRFEAISVEHAHTILRLAGGAV